MERHLPYGIAQCYLLLATQMNAPRLNPNQTGRYSIYLTQRDGRLSSPWCWLNTYISVFQPFCCRGTLNNRRGYSRNPMHWSVRSATYAKLKLEGVTDSFP